VNSQGPQERSITEAAADWAVRLQAGGLSAVEQAQLAQWQAADPRHSEALAFARQTWEALGELRLDPELGGTAAPRRQAGRPATAQHRPRRRRLPRVASPTAHREAETAKAHRG